MTDTNYQSIAPLAAYINRIGAEELNFRRFMVREYRGASSYYVEKCIIRINSDGTISCTKDEYKPTPQEAEEIKAAILASNFPRAIGARSSDTLRNQLGPAQLYEFWDRTNGELLMVQQRIDFNNGTKAYFPWTFFSDGVWRRMEPDGELPFWKPQHARNLPRIMVHEGAKTAAYVDNLVNNPEERDKLLNHPFMEDLIHYEHWGMIGGALAPHRANYSELHKAAPQELIYVCDNDKEGKAVLPQFSRHWNKALKGIIFGDEFPYNWDLADDIPSKHFHKGRYIGPKWSFLKKFATWATEKVPNSAARGAPIIVLKKEFREEWIHVIQPEAFIHSDWPGRILSADEFNIAVGPYSDSKNTHELLKKDIVGKREQLAYAPNKAPGSFASPSGYLINTHVPSDILTEQGDPQPWLDFMEHLCPDANDRKELLRWCATLIARPDIRMHYGVLAISETQGVGKGTLAEKILAPLVGRDNVSSPSEAEVVDSNYNYWLTHKRLAIVHEIYAGNSSRPYNKLKSILTDQYVTVMRKYMANYMIECWVHVFACSNTIRALKLSADDRRWFVPRIVELRRDDEYWNDFNNWLRFEGGLGIIKAWAEDWVQRNSPVMTGAPAPWSSLKKEVIEEGYSPGQILAYRTFSNLNELLERIKDGKEPALKQTWENARYLKDGNVIVLDSTIVRLIKEEIYEGRHNDRLERPLTIRKVAKSAGWWPSMHQAQVSAWGRETFGSRFICSSGEYVTKRPGELEILPIPIEVLRSSVM